MFKLPQGLFAQTQCCCSIIRNTGEFMIIADIAYGLGNQMFEYALARSLAIEYGEKLYLDRYAFSNDPLREYGLGNLNIVFDGFVKKGFNLKKIYIVLSKKIAKIHKYNSKSPNDFVKAGKYGYYNTFVLEKLDITPSKFPIKYVKGFYQCNKYFNKYDEYIKKELKVSKEPSEANKKWIEKIKMLNNPVCVHIRRGDYVGDDYFHVCKDTYYHDAVNKMLSLVENPDLVIFSEDIEYAKSLNLPGRLHFVDEDNPDYEELRLMYTCSHFIISNSTFSWWAQYLSDNDDKIVIAPSRWTGSNERDNRDIYMDDWILVDV